MHDGHQGIPKAPKAYTLDPLQLDQEQHPLDQLLKDPLVLEGCLPGDVDQGGL